MLTPAFERIIIAPERYLLHCTIGRPGRSHCSVGVQQRSAGVAHSQVHNKSIELEKKAGQSAKMDSEIDAKCKGTQLVTRRYQRPDSDLPISPFLKVLKRNDI
ncbi:unnamed protein product [Ceratitis capitata]|uniref:(Mediterranean fruit fly) hypothetical protein n=1 Tax=Ceratitis capitata TaxID=7213 RepID=A0A811U3L7_CERCA|nr:unnamed protein product [Ceratitis capitata]